MSRTSSGSKSRELGKGFYTIRIRYGFTDEPNILRALAQCRVGGFHFNLMETSFIIGREKLRLRPPQAPHGVMALARRALHPDVEQHPRRDRVFSDPAEPRRRARRPNRNLSDRPSRR